MKKINLLLVLLVILGLSVATSCTDDDVQEWPGGTAAMLLPVKIVGEDNGNQEVYVYDEYNRLTGCTYYTMSGSKLSKYSELNIEYNDIGQIVKATQRAENKMSNVYTVTYDGLKIVVKDTYYTRNIETDAQGRILKMEMIYNEVSDTPVEYKYSYDPKGNILRYEINNNINTYSYDDRNAIFSQVNTPQWFLVTILGKSFFIYKNCTEVKTSYLGEDGKESSPTTFQITHTYNANGYPVKYHIPNMSFCGTPPLPESNFRVEYTEAEDIHIRLH